MFSFMLFFFLGFVAVLAMSFYLLYSQERLGRALREENAKMLDALRVMGARLDAAGIARHAGDMPSPHDPVESLSLEAPSRPGEAGVPHDPALELRFGTPLEEGDARRER